MDGLESVSRVSGETHKTHKTNDGPPARRSILDLMRDLEGQPDGSLAREAHAVLREFLAWQPLRGVGPDYATWLALVTQGPCVLLVARDDQARLLRLVADLYTARPLADWRPEHGPVLWWAFPVQEPPWAGTPGDSDWPGHVTHWTPLVNAACLRHPNGEPIHGPE